MDELKSIIAKNLIYYRTQAKMTQYEIAQKLNYSDKSISKWERGAGIPDIFILKQLADMYGVKVDDFFNENDFSKPQTQQEKSTKKLGTIFITLISVGLVWFLACIAFVTMLWLKIPKAWLAFITAIPTSCLVLIVLTRIWYKLYVSGIFVSAFVWSLALTIYLFTINTHTYYLFIVCIPLQVLIVFWYILRYKTRKKEPNNE